MKKLPIILIIVSSGIMSACLKDKEEPRFTDFVTVVKDDSFTQMLFDDIQSESDVQHATSQTEALEKSMMEDSATITIDAGENGFADSAWTITIDFGDGIVGRYGWERKGKVIIDVQGFYKQEGATRVMTFDNYYVNDNKVEGTHTVTNIGFDSTEMAYVFDVAIENGVITKTDGKTITWNSNRQRKWTAGYDTPLTIADDEYKITGESHGTNSEGKAFVKTITSPLHIFLSCEYIQDGEVDITIEESKTALLNFGYSEGASSCDEYAKLTYAGKDFTFKMR